MLVAVDNGIVWKRVFKSKSDFESTLIVNAKGEAKFEYTPKHVVDSKRTYLEVTMNGLDLCTLWDVTSG